MFCRNCGKELADDAKFCACCGTQVMHGGSEKTPEAASVMPVQEKKNNAKLWVVGAAVVVVLLGVVFVGKGILKLSNGQEEHEEKTVAGAKADRIDDTDEAVPKDAEVQEIEEASGKEIGQEVEESKTEKETENSVVREAGFYHCYGSLVPWDELDIDVETDYTLDNYETEAKSPYKLFSHVNYVGDLVLPDNITRIGDFAFKGCDYLTSVDLSNTQITSIGKYAFNMVVGSPVSVDLPDTLTSIGDGAFMYCVLLESVDLSNMQITEIGDEVFTRCEHLTSIDLPDTLTSIGDRVFAGCVYLTSIDLPDTLAKIGDEAFADCWSLESVDLRDKQITSIESNTFAYCESLESVDLPNTITSIGGDAFYGCKSLTNINYAGTMEEWNAVDTSYSYWRSNSAIETITCSDGVITL